MKKIVKRISYKTKLEKLQKDYDKLQAQNNTLKMFYKPTYSDKLKILDNYYSWVTYNDYDANSAHTYFAYKKHLEHEKEVEHE